MEIYNLQQLSVQQGQRVTFSIFKAKKYCVWGYSHTAVNQQASYEGERSAYFYGTYSL